MKARLARRARGANARAVPVREGAEPPKALRAAIAGFTGKAGEVCELVTRKRRLLLVGCGDGGLPALEAAGALAAARLKNARKVALGARRLAPEAGCAFATGFRLRAWRDDRWRTKPEEDAPPARLRLIVDDPAAAHAAWERTQAPVEGALFARALVTEPSNTLTPAGFIARLDPLRQAGIEIEVLEREQLEREALGLLLAVGGASANAPCLAVLRWTGTLAQPPVAFVGKGITFDTGGVCVKPAQGMWEMRADMAGAAACAGAMLALALRRSPAPAVAVLPLAENALGAASYRPGDVLRAVDGTTVEVVDTDAEGRLVLADALAWVAARVRPQAVVDLATLTGSIVTALGHDRAGLFGDRGAQRAPRRGGGGGGGAGLAHADRRAAPRGPRRPRSPICATASLAVASRMPATVPPSCAHSWARRLTGPFPGRTSTSRVSRAARRRATGSARARPGLACACSTSSWPPGSRTRTAREGLGMTSVDFYHLTRTGPEAALPRLLGRTLDAGQRAVVLLREPARVAVISRALWASQDPPWLPHGSALTGEADLQPIWLATEDEAPPNGACYLFLLDGAQSARHRRVRARVRSLRRARRCGGSGSTLTLDRGESGWVHCSPTGSSASAVGSGRCDAAIQGYPGCRVKGTILHAEVRTRAARVQSEARTWQIRKSPASATSSRPIHGQRS